ncbi:MAG: hypothetical protein AMXMBFR26_23050 [Porticoccaceae bacterium]
MATVASGAADPVRTAIGFGVPGRVYPARVVGLGLGFFCVAGSLLGGPAPWWVWVALAVHGFAWPHFAYWRSRRAADPRPVEYRNLLVDSVAGGFWLPLMHFNVLPSVVVVTMLCLNNIALGGWRLLLRGLGVQLAGVALGALIAGVSPPRATGMRELLFSLPFLVVYPLLVGNLTYRLAQRLDTDKRKLLNLSRVDPLTGLWNRAYWLERTREEFSRYRRRGGAAVMVLGDVDHFKRINDQYGHGQGDRVLRRLAELLRARLRISDLLCRYGGEEFALLLPDTDGAGALAMVEQLRIAVQEASLSPVFPERLTMSFGLAQLDAAVADPAAWIEAADTALYQAKRSGRNRALVYQPPAAAPAAEPRGG